MIKQLSFAQFSLAEVNKIKWLLVLFGITNYSIKHQSFVYIQLNDQTILFQTIQLSINQQSSKYCYVSWTVQISIRHLFSHS